LTKHLMHMISLIRKKMQPKLSLNLDAIVTK
jgi:hypothetical protein